jgi:hypothetical protein
MIPGNTAGVDGQLASSPEPIESVRASIDQRGIDHSEGLESLLELRVLMWIQDETDQPLRE